MHRGDGPDYALRPAVDQLSHQVASVGSAVSLVGNQVNAVGQETALARSELATLRQDFERFAGQHELTANIQRAEVKVGNLEAEGEHRFGHYKVVRRSAVGSLQEFDSAPRASLVPAAASLRVVGSHLRQ